MLSRSQPVADGLALGGCVILQGREAPACGMSRLQMCLSHTTSFGSKRGCETSEEKAHWIRPCHLHKCVGSA